MRFLHVISHSHSHPLHFRFAAWYEKRQMRKIYSPLLEGLLALYLGFEWIQVILFNLTFYFMFWKYLVKYVVGCLKARLLCFHVFISCFQWDTHINTHLNKKKISKIGINGARSNNIFGNGENNFVAFSPFPNMSLLGYVYHLTLYVISLTKYVLICVTYWKQEIKIRKQSKRTLNFLPFFFSWKCN